MQDTSASTVGLRASQTIYADWPEPSMLAYTKSNADEGPDQNAAAHHEKQSWRQKHSHFQPVALKIFNP